MKIYEILKFYVRKNISERSRKLRNAVSLTLVVSQPFLANFYSEMDTSRKANIIVDLNSSWKLGGTD